MKLLDYFRASHQDRIKSRAVVLNCLKIINARRMKERAEGKRMKLDTGDGVNGRGDDNPHIYISDQSFKGVVAESKITAFEMWREILGFV